MLIGSDRFQWGSPQSDIGWRDEIAPGWIPADIGRREPVIRWMKVGTAILHEPFFKDTIARLRFAQYAPELECSLPALAEGARHLPPVAPSGVIVHMTRCGSTLLLNALRAAEGVVGLGEAEPFDSLLNLAASGSAHWADVGVRLLSPLASVFAHYLGDGTRKLIMKFGVWGVFGLKVLRKLWPNTPCVVVIRDPVEVLVSNWLTPPAWARESYLNNGIGPAGAFPPSLAAPAGIERCAWAIGRICTEALDIEASRCRIVDYNDLTLGTMKDIASYFGLMFSTFFDRWRAAPRERAPDGREAPRTRVQSGRAYKAESGY